jgi:hypothetical protein
MRLGSLVPPAHPATNDWDALSGTLSQDQARPGTQQQCDVLKTTLKEEEGRGVPITNAVGNIHRATGEGHLYNKQPDACVRLGLANGHEDHAHHPHKEHSDSHSSDLLCATPFDWVHSPSGRPVYCGE